MTIDPSKITDFNRTQAQLEEMALFATLAAGKPARFMAKALDAFLTDAAFVYGSEISPFELVRVLIGNDRLRPLLEKHRIGQYTRITRCWDELTGFDVSKSTPGAFLRITNRVDLRDAASLEKVYGIGMKTARFIIVHSVKGALYAVLDTHVIKELRQLGYPIEVKEREVDGKTISYVPLDRTHYLIYESYVLEQARKTGLTPAEWDLKTWNKWTRAPKELAA